MNEEKTITTPSGNHKVILKSFLTGREQRLYRRSLLEIDESKKAESLENVENATIKAVVISLDGSPDNVVERMLDLPYEDYSFLLDEVNQVIQVLSKKKEKNSDGNMTTGSKDGE